MATKLTGGTARDLNTLFETGLVGGDRTDGQLVERFRSGRGPAAEAAFAALIRRHGPMVLRVCRGVLNDEHDAQDAFQATFLVLVRRADSIRNRCSVASWLYGVAHRVASRAKVDGVRRRTHERRAASLISELQYDGAGGLLPDQPALDEEIRRLPEKYRAVVVLCYLEGLTQDQAAASLGWPSGTVRGRLCRARELLRARLSRRGFVVALGAEPARCIPREEPYVSAVLSGSTPGAGLLAAVGKSGVDVPVSEAVDALAGGVSRAIVYAQLKFSLAVIGMGLVTASAAGLAGNLGPPLLRSVRVSTEESARAPEPTSRPAPLSTAAPDVERPAPPMVHAPPADDNLIDRDPSIQAFPLEKIEVDGDLGDWPQGIVRHPVHKLLVVGTMGYGGLKGGDLSTSPDLSPAFSVGYNLEEQLLYLAVVVRDDKVVVGNTSHMDTDAVEVYIDGLRSENSIPIPPSPFWSYVNLSDLPVQQYVTIPGPGKVYGTPYDTNPVLLAGDLRQTRTRMAFRRVGDVTTYEWAIQPFDRYPDQPTKLELSKRIGFDLAVVDKDKPATSPRGMDEPYDDRVTWAYWGPQWAGVKTFNAGNLGELILAAPR